VPYEDMVFVVQNLRRFPLSLLEYTVMITCVSVPRTRSIVGSKPSNVLSAKANAANNLMRASGC